MKLFKFRLDKNLNIAYQEEKTAKEELQLRIKQLDIIKQELEIINKKLQLLEESIINDSINSFSFQQILIKKEYLPVLRDLIIEKEKHLKNAQNHFEKARQNLIEKSQATKTLEKLKEKEWSEYLTDISREDQKILDEIAVTRHFRNNSV